jgi:transposase
MSSEKLAGSFIRSTSTTYFYFDWDNDVRETGRRIRDKHKQGAKKRVSDDGWERISMMIQDR